MSTTITIIEQISSTEVIVKCARCRGTGMRNPDGYSDGPACSVCGGKGLLLLQIERLPLVKCKRCHGTGRQVPNGYADGVKCKSCGGAGCQPIAGEMRIIK